MATTALMHKPKGGVSGLMKSYGSLQNRIKHLNEKAEETMDHVIGGLTVAASAFVFGAIQGAYYEPDPKKPGDKPGLHIFNVVPIELGVGLAAQILALMGVGGKHAVHLANIGNGAVAAYAANAGRGWGYKFKKERDAKGSSSAGETDIKSQIRDLLNA